MAKKDDGSQKNVKAKLSAEDVRKNLNAGAGGKKPPPMTYYLPAQPQRPKPPPTPPTTNT